MEQESILEWVEYHQSIGFDHFFIYGNDDDFRVLAEVLAPYISRRVVTFTHCAELGAQIKMYVHFLQWHSHSCEWLCFLDQDEYVRLDGFDDDVNQLTSRARANYDSIQLNWLNYGTSGYRDRPRGSVLRNYTRRASGLDINTKHISRAKLFTVPGSISGAFWHSMPSTHSRTCSALFEPATFWDYLINSELKNAYVDYVSRRSESLLANGCVAHFYLKSEADFKRRVDRSLAGQFAGQIMYKHLDEDPTRKKELIDKSNAVEDLYLSKYWESYIDSLMLGNPPM